MLTLQLDDDFWIAYSTEKGTLTKIWRDGVNLDGAVYTTAHGPQPTSIGPAYLIDANQRGWHFAVDGQSMPAQIQYRGHKVVNGIPSLQIEAILPTGETVLITETPAYVKNDTGNAGLQRTFETANVPNGTSIQLYIALNSLASASSYETNGSLEVLSSSDATLDGMLTLNDDGPTTLTTYFQSPLIQPAAAAEAASKPAGLLLIERSDCVACHNAELQTVGPSYKAIADRYPQNDLSVIRLANKVIEGGSGVWGEAVMTPHPNLSTDDAKAMVAYIMSLGSGEPATTGALDVGRDPTDFTNQRDGSTGLTINMYPILGSALTLNDMQISDAPYYSGVISEVHAISEGYMGDVRTNFFVEISGVLNVPETDNYVMRLVSDDGGRLYLDNELLIDNDGLHGPDPKDSELILQAGPHPLRITYFQAGGGAALSLQWAKHGDNSFSVIPSEYLSFSQDDLREAMDYNILTGVEDGDPGDKLALSNVHPSFSVETIRPGSFEPKVGGLDVMEDGRVVVSTWDAEGAVYILSNIEQGNPEQIEVKKVATGLAEPLGLKVVDGDIYVLQKQELTRLVDTNGDDIIDVYETVANDWGVTSNFHEFAFGLVYKDGYFYGTLATAILPGGASANPQDPDRGTVIKISKDTGEVEVFARGLRTPNGIALGIDNEIFVADNQGDWLPASKIVHIVEGEFYGSRSVDFEGLANVEEKLPVAWLPQDEIGNSPSQPAILDVGPYRNQMIHGEVTHGGIKRLFVEEVNGQWQSALFRFTQGLEAGVNRLVWGNDGKLYIGGVGNPGNWGHAGKLMHGLQRMTYTGAPVFEMLAIRLQPDGFEIEFTEPLADGVGEEASNYNITQWYYLPTADYGGPKINEERLNIQSVEVSPDRGKVKLRIDGLKANHMVYFHLNYDTLQSQAGRSLWSTEAWYTLNELIDG